MASTSSMTSDAMQANLATATIKKRRLKNACDVCKAKKVRCDSATMPNNICTNCIAFGTICTHVVASLSKPIIAAKRPSETLRAPRESSGSGSNENQNKPKERNLPPYLSSNIPVRNLAASILSQTRPYQLPSDPAVVMKSVVELAQYISILEKELALHYTSISEDSPAPKSLFRPSSPDLVGDDESLVKYPDTVIDDVLANHLGSLTLEPQSRFYGQTSTASLVKAALDAKQDFVGPTEEICPSFVKRPEFWHVYPWQFVPDDEYTPLEFPDQQLIKELTNLYFQHVNDHLAVLHRGYFEKSIEAGFHFAHYHFGCTVLVVCALGARFSDNPDVFMEGAGEHSAGWQWYRQVQPVRRSYKAPTSVYELQLCTLCSLYLHGTSNSESLWMFAGLGLRLAQDVGAHKRARPGTKPSSERELWKRAFWGLITIDILSSLFSGRPRATTTQDFDQDLPIECDDEYWNHPDPAQRFKQPHGKPARISQWIQLLKILEVMSTAQTTLYSTKHDPANQDRIIRQLDSALNEWFSNIPHHLRWDPHGDAGLFYEQSASLHSVYYFVQMTVHKTSIATGGKSGLPSLAICANAARACARIVGTQYKRTGHYSPLTTVLMALFNSAVLLLVNLWGGRRGGFASNPTKELDDIKEIIKLLHVHENRWQVAGRLCDLLDELLYLQESNALRLTGAISRGQKRRRETESEGSPSSTLVATPPDSASVQLDPVSKLAIQGRTFDTGAFISSAPIPQPDQLETDLNAWMDNMLQQTIAHPVAEQLNLSDPFASYNMDWGAQNQAGMPLDFGGVPFPLGQDDSWMAGPAPQQFYPQQDTQQWGQY